ncbi:ABC transporter ATP-binding protein [Halomonas stenophila]|uniref:ABC-type iron transport system FetAB ATPase subunit n=1 Tax=Halomonas stenophila TaxID=795312 RepID=A0A7W5EQ96_9GAMM|nr:ATP-binding cassette domain-containing protein [Halomonas stenophila]MBB3229457.1 ABC-type iron transport system FetAB ATPase subunit [Halomonas stenophila]
MATHPPLCLDRLDVGDLRPVSLRVAAGEVLCLAGPSGAGKSRLLRAIADLEPHGGMVTLGELAQADLPGHAWRRRVMLVPAESQWWAERVGDHFPAGDVRGLSTLGLTPAVLDWPVGRLSSGEKQRLALLRALARGPSVLLLDEPTANLDDATTRGVEAWLMARIREGGWPVIWVAHDPAQIARVATRRGRLESGRLVEEAPATCK